MLHEIHIKDLGVIADATLQPAAGMTVVTGETGAGKTMVVTGLGLLLGERADARIVRNGAQRCLVEGIFSAGRVEQQVAELGGEIDDDEVLVSRQVAANGRSRAHVGGVQTTLGQLTQLSEALATIHGQSEQIRLGNADRQREVLDLAGGAQLSSLLNYYRETFLERSRLRTELAELIDLAQQRAHEHDMLQFGLSEIEQVDPQPGEDAALAAEAAKLQAVDDLRLLAEQTNRLLSGSPEGDIDEPGAVGLIAMSRKTLQQIADLDQQTVHFVDKAASLSVEINDLAADVASYLADLDADPLRLEAIAERRAALQGLTRKYGQDIDAVLDWQRQAAARIIQLSGDDQRIAELRKQIEVLGTRIAEVGGKISELRREGADALAAAAQRELAALAMPHARIIFDLKPLDEPGPWGLEQVHLMFAANPGVAPAPLAKVASGGELSRVRLALEVVLAADDPGHVFVFDEVDAGIGGAVATEVGRRLATLAQNSQVIVVTHLAQVAAFADAHYVVAKTSSDEVTTSGLTMLDDDQRVAELARMMGGDAGSDKALEHARELYTAAKQMTKS